MSTANTALTEAEHVRSEVHVLRDSLHRYAVANEALWQLLSARLGISEDDLHKTIESIEQQHAQQHGATICPECHRPGINHLRKCIYCGHDLGPQPIFS